jgi:tripartite-type tricarboxylate transporter receptor subunit TctC
MFDQASKALPQVRAGRIKAYAFTAKSHLAEAPDIPTVDEAGLPEFYVSVWHGVLMPRATPREIVGNLNETLVDALADSNFGQEIPPREQQTPEVLRAYQ